MIQQKDFRTEVKKQLDEAHAQTAATRQKLHEEGYSKADIDQKMQEEFSPFSITGQALVEYKKLWETIQ